MLTYADLLPTILDFAEVSFDPKSVHGKSFLKYIENPAVSSRNEVFLSHTFHKVTMFYPVRVVRDRRYKLTWNIANGLSFPFASDLYASKTWQGILERGDTVYGKRSIDAYLDRPKFEFYDLKNDPDELVNLVDYPEHADRIELTKTKIKNYQKITKDLWVVKWEHE